MKAPISHQGPTVWSVTASEDHAALPDFVTRIDTGMGTLDDEHVTETSGSRPNCGRGEGPGRTPASDR